MIAEGRVQSTSGSADNARVRRQDTGRSGVTVGRAAAHAPVSLTSFHLLLLHLVLDHPLLQRRWRRLLCPIGRHKRGRSGGATWVALSTVRALPIARDEVGSGAVDRSIPPRVDCLPRIGCWFSVG